MAKQVAEFIEDAAIRLERRLTGKEKPIVLPWEPLSDAVGGGLWPGLYVVVGNTGTGKTQLVLEMILKAAQSGTPCLYVGLEMGPMDLTARLLGLMSGMDWSDLFLGKGSDKQLRRALEDHGPELAQLPLRVEFGEPNGWPYRNLVRETEALRHAYPQNDRGERPLLVVLDYLQLVGTHRGREERRERMLQAAYIGRALATVHDAAVVMVSSTARANYSLLDGDSGSDTPIWKTEPARLVGSSKESGDIEFAADGVWVLTRQPLSSNMWMAIAKWRAGRPCWIPFHFTGSRMVTGQSPNLPPKLMDMARRRLLLKLLPGQRYSDAAAQDQSGLGDGDWARLRAVLFKEEVFETSEDRQFLWLPAAKEIK